MAIPVSTARPLCLVVKFSSQKGQKRAGRAWVFTPSTFSSRFLDFFVEQTAHTQPVRAEMTHGRLCMCAPSFPSVSSFSSLFMGDLCILSSIELQCKMSKIKRPFLAVQSDGLEVAREVEAN